MLVIARLARFIIVWLRLIAESNATIPDS